MIVRVFVGLGGCTWGFVVTFSRGLGEKVPEGPGPFPWRVPTPLGEVGVGRPREVSIEFGSPYAVVVPGRAVRAGRVIVGAGRTRDIVVNVAAGAADLPSGTGLVSVEFEVLPFGSVGLAVRDVRAGRSGEDGRSGRGAEVVSEEVEDPENWRGAQVRSEYVEDAEKAAVGFRGRCSRAPPNGSYPRTALPIVFHCQSGFPFHVHMLAYKERAMQGIRLLQCPVAASASFSISSSMSPCLQGRRGRLTLLARWTVDGQVT